MMDYEEFKKMQEKYRQSEDGDIHKLLAYVDTLHFTLARAVRILERIHFITGSATGFEVGNHVFNEKQDDIGSINIYD